MERRWKSLTLKNDVFVGKMEKLYSKTWINTEKTLFLLCIFSITTGILQLQLLSALLFVYPVSLLSLFLLFAGVSYSLCPRLTGMPHFRLAECDLKSFLAIVPCSCGYSIHTKSIVGTQFCCQCVYSPHLFLRRSYMIFVLVFN